MNAMKSTGLAMTCEDYDSEADKPIPETIRQANVTIKRSSHPSLNGDKKNGTIALDAASDSGYSSRTAATMSSADSAFQSTKKQKHTEPFLKPPAPAQQRDSAIRVDASNGLVACSPSKQRRPTLAEARRPSMSQSPRKQPAPAALARTTSVSRRAREYQDERYEESEGEECTDPNCTECTPTVATTKSRTVRRRPRDSALAGLAVMPPPPERTASASSVRTSAARRQSIMYADAPNPVMESPSQRERRRSSSKARPQSMHAGLPYHPQYPGMDVHGQPQGQQMSGYGYQNMHMMGYPHYMNATPPNAGFYTPPPMGPPSGPPMPTDYSMRPQLKQRATDSQYDTRRGYHQAPGPVISYGAQQALPPASAPPASSKNTARYGGPVSGPVTSAPATAARRPATKQKKPKTAKPVEASYFDHSTSESEDSYNNAIEDESSEEETYEYDYHPQRKSQTMAVAKTVRRTEADDRMRMPPPAVPVQRRQSQSRPRRQTISQQQVAVSGRPSSMYRAPSPEYDTRVTRTAGRSNTVTSSRASSTRRPSLASSGHTKATSYSGSSGGAQVLVESSSAARRRVSYMGHEQHAELVSQRDQQVYEEPRARRRAETESRVKIRDDREEKRRTYEQAAEAYIKRDNPQPELSAQTIRDHKRRSRGLSGALMAPGDDEDETGSRISASRRTTVTEGDGAVKVRINQKVPMQLEFNGDMEGRCISWNPIEGGMAELVISGRSGDRVYNDSKYDTASRVGGGRVPEHMRLEPRERDETSVKSKRSNGSDGRRKARKHVEEQHYTDGYGYYHYGA